MGEHDTLKTELRWAAVVIASVAAIILVVVVSSFVMAMHPPSHVETIDPTTLGQNKEFAESDLGAQVNPDGTSPMGESLQDSL
jgi:cytochrome c oxidase subunit II